MLPWSKDMTFVSGELLEGVSVQTIICFFRSFPYAAQSTWKQMKYISRSVGQSVGLFLLLVRQSVRLVAE